MHRASCPCGQLSLASSVDPEVMVICNCKACQKRTGSAFVSGAFFSRDAVKIEGTATTWARTGDSGRTVTSSFCPQCGTTVFWGLEMRPGLLGVSIGCFDTAPPSPRMAIWTSQRHDWIEFPEDWQTFPQGRPAAT